jgi:hypothetical protein
MTSYTDPKNVFVCTVLHHSDLRPQGLNSAVKFYESWKKHNFPYTLAVIDNESTCDYPFFRDDEDIIFIREDDQLKSGAVTGAWNKLCKLAVDRGAEIITGFADDVILNETLHSLVDATVDNNVVYAPLTNTMLGNLWGFQKSSGPKPGHVHDSKSVNGFWLSFTAQLWKEKSRDGILFNDKEAPDITRWSAQESIFLLWNKKYNTTCRVIGDCWIEHTKHRAWTRAAKKYG